MCRCGKYTRLSMIFVSQPVLLYFNYLFKLSSGSAWLVFSPRLLIPYKSFSISETGAKLQHNPHPLEDALKNGGVRS